jgi:hypothetical protein
MKQKQEQDKATNDFFINNLVKITRDISVVDVVVVVVAELAARHAFVARLFKTEAIKQYPSPRHHM